MSSVLECSKAPQPASFPKPILVRCCSSGKSIGASSAREKRSDSWTMVQLTLSMAGGRESEKLNLFDPGYLVWSQAASDTHDGMMTSSVEISMDPTMASDCMYLATMTSS